MKPSTCRCYLHPAPPPEPVRRAYYDRLPGDASQLLSIAGWGWHSETAIHVLRMVLAGTFDRHPKLKLIIGHMGEGLPAMFARCDQVFADEARNRLTRTVSQTLTDQVWVTTSGFFSLAPLLPLLMTFGADRVMFSVDYPFSPNQRGRDFLAALPLSPDGPGQARARQRRPSAEAQRVDHDRFALARPSWSTLCLCG